ADGASRPEEDARNHLEGDGVVAWGKIAPTSRDEVEGSVFDHEPASAQPEEAMAVGMRNSSRLEPQATFQYHGQALSRSIPSPNARWRPIPLSSIARNLSESSTSKRPLKVTTGRVRDCPLRASPCVRRRRRSSWKLTSSTSRREAPPTRSASFLSQAA